MEKDSETRMSVNRRGFLRGLGLGVGAAAVGAVAGSGASEAAAPAPEGEGKASGGYHLTDHVRQAYDSARY